MARVLVATEKKGWYLDAADPEGKKVRKQDGDQIFDNLMDAQQALAVLTKAHGPQSNNGKADDSAPETVADTGKTLKGQTTEIRCQWKEGGRRCTNTRTIKVQDKFQVRFCVEHQEAHRKKTRNERQKQKRREAKATA